MTDWPKDDKPLSFGDVTDPVIDAIKFAYNLTRKNSDKDIPWSGPNHNKSTAHICFPPAEQLTAQKLAYANDEQGRDALRVIVAIAVQLGIEQGRRMTLSGSEIEILRTQLKISKMINKWVSEKFKHGEAVRKVKGYKFEGLVVAAFKTKAGKVRLVVDNEDGLLHIFNENQLEKRFEDE